MQSSVTSHTETQSSVSPITVHMVASGRKADLTPSSKVLVRNTTPKIADDRAYHCAQERLILSRLPWH